MKAVQLLRYSLYKLTKPSPVPFMKNQLDLVHNITQTVNNEFTR